jgi:hypothetical protein
MISGRGEARRAVSRPASARTGKIIDDQATDNTTLHDSVGGGSMGFFDNPEEQERKAKLKAMEDKRVAFAQRLAKEGFAPQRMLLTQSANGGFVALCRPDSRILLSSFCPEILLLWSRRTSHS